MSDPTDILNQLAMTDLSSVETGYPVLPAGLYEVTVAEIKTEANKAQTGHNLKMKLTLVNGATDREGKPVNPGFPLFDLISLVKTEKYDPLPALARFREAATGTKSGAFMPLEQYMGATLIAQVKIESSTEYGDRNRIVRYTQKK